jgi:hypothetical protein
MMGNIRQERLKTQGEVSAVRETQTISEPKTTQKPTEISGVRQVTNWKYIDMEYAIDADGGVSFRVLRDSVEDLKRMQEQEKRWLHLET